MRIKFINSLFLRKTKPIDSTQFNQSVIEWQELLKHDFYSDSDFNGGIWDSVDSIWADKIIENLSEGNLNAAIKTIRDCSPLEIRPQITYFLTKLQVYYPDKALVMQLLIDTKTINGYNEVQKYINKNFSMHNKIRQKDIMLPDDIKPFCFSTYSSDVIGSTKAQHIIDNYKALTDQQAYILIVSIFGLQYANAKQRKILATLIQTAPRYSKENLSIIPSYELEALEALAKKKII